MSENNAEQAAILIAHIDKTPFIVALGGQTLEYGQGRGRMRLPYSAHLVGDPDTGVIHGGVITAMLDQTSGIAIISALTTIMPFATLDLRVDYMKPATPNLDILFEAECLKITHDFIFARAIAYQTSRDEPIALSTGAFVLSRNARPDSAPVGA